MQELIPLSFLSNLLLFTVLDSKRIFYDFLAGCKGLCNASVGCDGNCSAPPKILDTCRVRRLPSKLAHSENVKSSC